MPITLEMTKFAYAKSVEVHQDMLSPIEAVKSIVAVVYEDFEQELNLHFVGITRAKNYCVLVTSNSRLNGNYDVKQGNPSQFLSLPGLDGLLKKSGKNFSRLYFH